MWKYFIKPLLFLFRPETAHFITFSSLKIAFKFPIIRYCVKKIFHFNYTSEIELFGLKFKNPVGLAAGLDKNGEYINELASLGFSHIEIGTITPRAQEGNPKPRLFRLPTDEALINRMGFNNEGAEKIAKRLSHLKKPKDLILGINIGKNKETNNDIAWKDYVLCFETLFDYGDYFTINVSSPNTPGLRGLQEKEPLINLLNKIMDINKSKPNSKPILLKIAPDLETDQLMEIKQLAIDIGISGIIMGNTTLRREPLKTNRQIIDSIGAGGMSGVPLVKHSLEKLVILNNSEGKIPLIGVGGISTVDAAQAKLDNGASLIQIYSGLVFKGPILVKKILKGIKK